MTPRSSGRAMPLSSTRPCSAAVSASRRHQRGAQATALPGVLDQHRYPGRAGAVRVEVGHADRAAPVRRHGEHRLTGVGGRADQRLQLAGREPRVGTGSGTGGRPVSSVPRFGCHKADHADGVRTTREWRRVLGVEHTVIDSVELGARRPRRGGARRRGSTERRVWPADAPAVDPGLPGWRAARGGAVSQALHARRRRPVIRCRRSTGSLPNTPTRCRLPWTSLAAATSISTHSPLESRNVTRDRSSTR